MGALGRRSGMANAVAQASESRVFGAGCRRALSRETSGMTIV